MNQPVNNQGLQPMPENQPQQRPNNSNNAYKFFCQICGKTNHITINYWYRFDYSYQSEDLPQSLVAIKLNDEHDPSFYEDSGATAHMTNDTGKLSYDEPYKGNDMIFVGDGNALPISHVGDVCVSTKEEKFKLNKRMPFLPHDVNIGFVRGLGELGQTG